MSYDGKVLKRALEQYEKTKMERQEGFEVKERWIYSRSPRIEEINRELTKTVGKIMSQALREGSDPKIAIARLQDENLELQRERAELLKGLGCEIDFFEQKPACSLCNDTGFVGAKMCRCLRNYYAREQNRELSHMLDLGSQSFDTFSFDFYSNDRDFSRGISPRENMELIYEVCSDYAFHFGSKGGNLFMSGAPGLGKTFLSACIAREVSNQGFSVVYDTAGHIFGQMEEQKFGRTEDEATENENRRYAEADLLILDDLGTEMTTNFIVSALYQLINTRMITGKKTIISSNLSVEDIGKKYGEAIRSRLAGEFTVLPFFGKDIRQIKKENEN